MFVRAQCDLTHVYFLTTPSPVKPGWFSLLTYSCSWASLSNFLIFPRDEAIFSTPMTMYTRLEISKWCFKEMDRSWCHLSLDISILFIMLIFVDCVWISGNSFPFSIRSCILRITNFCADTASCCRYNNHDSAGFSTAVELAARYMEVVGFSWERDEAKETFIAFISAKDWISDKNSFLFFF